MAVVLALMIAAKAKTAKCASTKKPREYNEQSAAYDMRVFLLHGVGCVEDSSQDERIAVTKVSHTGKTFHIFSDFSPKHT